MNKKPAPRKPARKTPAKKKPAVKKTAAKKPAVKKSAANKTVGAASPAKKIAAAAKSFPLEGGCTCRAVRYRMMSAPLFVHCCHCRWCQRETGSAFVLNAMIEADRVRLLSGAPVVVTTPSASGRGQKITRCPTCHVALWSTYAGGGDKIRFVRVGTLDDPDRLPPDIHIFTSTKQPWVILPPGARVHKEFYDVPKTWPAESLARFRAARHSV